MNQRAIRIYGTCSIVNLLLLLFGIETGNMYFVGYQICMFVLTTLGFFATLRKEHKRVDRLSKIMGKES